MALLKRILGICETKKPKDPRCWRYSKGRVIIAWARAPELQKPCGAIRLEGKSLPERLLVLYGMNGQFYAYRNRYTFMRRRIDPILGSEKIRCCGIPGPTFDYSGHVTSGPVKEPLKTYRVEMNKCNLIVWLDENI